MKLTKNVNKNIVDIFDYVLLEKKFHQFIPIYKMIELINGEFINRLQLDSRESAIKYIESVENFNFFDEENYEFKAKDSIRNTYGDRNNLNGFAELLIMTIRTKFDVHKIFNSIEPKTESWIRGYPEEDVRGMVHYVDCNKIRDWGELHRNMSSYYYKIGFEREQLDKYLSGKCLHADTSYTKDGHIKCNDCGTIFRNTF